MEFEDVGPEDGDGDGDPKEESGWKLVHGDVFRFPKHPMLFSACVGTGAQVRLLHHNACAHTSRCSPIH